VNTADPDRAGHAGIRIKGSQRATGGLSVASNDCDHRRAGSAQTDAKQSRLPQRRSPPEHGDQRFAVRLMTAIFECCRQPHRVARTDRVQQQRQPLQIEDDVPRR
jgi:hypothetical protein